MFTLVPGVHPRSRTQETHLAPARAVLGGTAHLGGALLGSAAPPSYEAAAVHAANQAGLIESGLPL